MIKIKKIFARELKQENAKTRTIHHQNWWKRNRSSRKVRNFLKDFSEIQNQNSSSRWWKIEQKLAEKLEIPQEFLKVEESPMRKLEMLR